MQCPVVFLFTCAGAASFQWQDPLLLDDCLTDDEKMIRFVLYIVERDLVDVLLMDLWHWPSRVQMLEHVPQYRCSENVFRWR